MARTMSQTINDDAVFYLRNGRLSKRNIEYVLEEIYMGLYSMKRFYQEFEIGLIQMILRAKHMIEAEHPKASLIERKKKGYEKLLSDFKEGKEIKIYNHTFSKFKT